MKPLSRIALILTLSAPLVSGQTIVEPTTSNSSGGINVTIRGSNFLRGCTAPACNTASFSAFFGDTPAQIVSIRDDEIVLVAPPHRPGRTMILVSRPGFLIASFPDFQYEADQESFDRGTVLLPLIWTGETQGGYGSRWKADLTIYDRETGFIELDPRFLPGPGDPNPSRFLSVGDILSSSRDFTERVTTQLRVHETSRQGETWGVAIPIVRDTDLHVERVTLAAVPTDSRFRVALRVYMVNGMRLTGAVTLPFRIRFFPGESQNAIAEDIVSVTTPYATRLEIPQEPLYPAIYQNHDLVRAYPSLGAHAAVRIEIEPAALLPLNRVPLFWAFVSVAHKETQHVTIISPE